MSSETDQLLQQNDPHAPAEQSKGKLDKFQLIIVLLIQVAEPVTATVIFPFVNQFVRETGITGGDEAKTGYYAGIIESMFFITECLTVYHWGRASDQIGRKPILVWGLVGLTFVTLGFGLSRTFWMMVICRGAQGIFNGNIGVTKSVMAEISDPSTIAYAFSTISIMWSSGTTVGPILGGLLSRPADRWPNVFGKLEFFSFFPYFLPCAGAALVVLFSVIMSSVFLKETLPAIVEKKQRLADFGNNGSLSANIEPGSLSSSSAYGATLQGGGDLENVPTPPPPTFMSLLTRRTVIPMINIGYLAFVNQSLVVLIPLMFSTSIPYGGLGFDPFTIGVIMGCWGVVNGIVQLFGFVRVSRILGLKKTYMFAYGSQAISLTMFALMSILAKSAGRVTGVVWAILVCFLLLNTTASMAYASMHIIIINSATKENLGSTNGLAQMVASVMRSLAPSLTSSLFSISLEKELLGGTLVFWALVFITLTGVYTASLLPSKMRVG